MEWTFYSIQMQFIIEACIQEDLAGMDEPQSSNKIHNSLVHHPNVTLIEQSITLASRAVVYSKH